MPETSINDADARRHRRRDRSTVVAAASRRSSSTGTGPRPAPRGARRDGAARWPAWSPWRRTTLASSSTWPSSYDRDASTAVRYGHLVDASECLEIAMTHLGQLKAAMSHRLRLEDEQHTGADPVLTAPRSAEVDTGPARFADRCPAPRPSLSSHIQPLARLLERTSQIMARRSRASRSGRGRTPRSAHVAPHRRGGDLPRPQHSWWVRLLGLVVRLRAELTVLTLLLIARFWAWPRLDRADRPHHGPDRGDRARAEHPGHPGIPPVPEPPMVVDHHPAPDARLLRADPHDDPPRPTAAAGVVPALPRGGEGPSVAPGRALGQGPRTGHHRNRRRVLGRRRTDHPVTPTGRPGGRRGHPPRPAHRRGTDPAGGRRPRPDRPAPRIRSSSRTTRPAPTVPWAPVARSCRCPRAPACPHRPPIPPQRAPTARTAPGRTGHAPGPARTRHPPGPQPARPAPANRPSRGSAASTSATTSDHPPAG